MSAKISYLQGSKLKRRLLTDDEYNSCVFYDSDEGLNVYTDERDVNRVLHSEGDTPAVEEDFDERTEWIHKGLLHRVHGPAFTCTTNKEYHAFNMEMDADIFHQLQPFFIRLERFCLAHNIAFSESTIDSTQEYHLDFERLTSGEDALDALQHGYIVLTKFETGEFSTVSLDDLESETSSAPSAALALLGIAVAGVCATNMIKSYSGKVAAPA